MRETGITVDGNTTVGDILNAYAVQEMDFLTRDRQLERWEIPADHAPMYLVIGTLDTSWYDEHLGCVPVALNDDVPQTLTIAITDRAAMCHVGELLDHFRVGRVQLYAASWKQLHEVIRQTFERPSSETTRPR